MKMSEWVDEACWYMIRLTGPWEDKQHLRDYCESLYETYVEEMGDDPFSPKGAVDEDMTYWDAE